ncbi:MAG: peptidoglycan-binding protein [Bacillota bacterium]
MDETPENIQPLDEGEAGSLRALTVDGLPYFDFGSRNLRLTSPRQQGTDVKILQVLLKVADQFEPGPVDGIFGPQTDQAVRAFQSYYGIGVDGIVGPETFWTLGQSTGRFLGGQIRFASRTLRQGMSGGDVTVLQNRLNVAGQTPAGPATGFFNAATTAAVKAFQTRYGLTPDGIVGPVTAYNLKLRTWMGGRNLSRSTKGTAVRQLQRWLNSINEVQIVPVDGFFGASTESAVRSFQSFNHITADGIVGPQTFNVLGRYTNEIGLDSEGRIVYRHLDLTTGVYSIIAVKPDGSNPINLTGPLAVTPGFPRWSPNRQWVAYTADDNKLYVVPASGGTPQAIDTGVIATDFSWSPDNVILAVVKADGIHLVNRITTVDTFLVAGGFPSFFPSGTIIAFAGGADLVLQTINIDGTNLVTQDSETPPYHNVAVSPDGSRIVYTTPGASISFVIIFDVATGTRLTVPPGPQGKDYCPAWSPSGKLVALSATDFQSGRGFFGIIRIADKFAKIVFDIAESTCFSGCSITWGPNSDRVAYASGCTAGDSLTGTIFSVGLFASAPVQVVPGARNDAANWTPVPSTP